MQDKRWSLAVHGGAGTMDRATMREAQQAGYQAALGAALDGGAAVLADGGSALDAVEAAVVMLEDDPRFNAGRGAVFTYNGTNELDASIMDGRNRAAGAVTGVSHVRPPSSDRLTEIPVGEPRGVEPVPNGSVEIIQTSCSGS